MTQVSQGSTNTGGTSGSGSLFNFGNIYGAGLAYIQTAYQDMADAVGDPTLSGEIGAGFDFLGAAPSIIESGWNAIEGNPGAAFVDAVGGIGGVIGGIGGGIAGSALGPEGTIIFLCLSTRNEVSSTWRAGNVRSRSIAICSQRASA